MQKAWWTQAKRESFLRMPLRLQASSFTACRRVALPNTHTWKTRCRNRMQHENCTSSETKGPCVLRVWMLFQANFLARCLDPFIWFWSLLQLVSRQNWVASRQFQSYLARVGSGCVFVSLWKAWCGFVLCDLHIVGHVDLLASCSPRILPMVRSNQCNGLPPWNAGKQEPPVPHESQPASTSGTATAETEYRNLGGPSAWDLWCGSGKV